MAGCSCCSGEPCANCSPTKLPATLHVTHTIAIAIGTFGGCAMTLPTGTYPLTYGGCSQTPNAWSYIYLGTCGGSQYQVNLSFTCNNTPGPANAVYSASWCGPSSNAPGGIDCQTATGFSPYHVNQGFCLGSAVTLPGGGTTANWTTAQCSPPDWDSPTDGITVTA